LPKASGHDAAFIARFEKLWKAVTSTKDMAEQLGLVSKNAICGLRARFFRAGIDVPPRPTPIRSIAEAPSRPRLRPRPTPACQIVALRASLDPGLLSREEWLPWFNRLSAQRRAAIAQAPHAEGCLLRSGGGLWDCTCGVSMPAAHQPPQAVAVRADGLRTNGAPANGAPADEALADAVEAVLDRWEPQAAPATPAETDAGVDDGAETEGDEAPAEPVSPRARLVYAEGCQRPIGLPGSKQFRYCDAPVEGRSSYCADCRRAIYRPNEERKSLDKRLGIPVRT
jgi:GcrA cell cycle regulator